MLSFLIILSFPRLIWSCNMPSIKVLINPETLHWKWLFCALPHLTALSQLRVQFRGHLVTRCDQFEVCPSNGLTQTRQRLIGPDKSRQPRPLLLTHVLELLWQLWICPRLSSWPFLLWGDTGSGWAECGYLKEVLPPCIATSYCPWGYLKDVLPPRPCVPVR